MQFTLGPLNPLFFFIFLLCSSLGNCLNCSCVAKTKPVQELACSLPVTIHLRIKPNVTETLFYNFYHVQVIDVITQQGGFGAEKIKVIKSLKNPNFCGLDLQKGEDYLYQGHLAVTITLSTCNHIRPWKNLSKEDKNLLKKGITCGRFIHV